MTVSAVGRRVGHGADGEPTQAGAGPRLRRIRMVAVAVVVWAAAGIVVGVPGPAGVVAACAWGLAVVATAAAFGMPRLRVVLAVVAVAGAASGAAVAHVAFAEPARAGAVALVGASGRAIEAEVAVTGKVEPSGFGGVRFVGAAETARVGGETRRMDVPVSVWAPDVPPGVDLGARVVVRGEAAAAEPGERAVLSISARGGVRLRDPPSGVLAGAAGLRRGLSAAVAGLPEPGSGLVPGLAVGDTAGVGADLDGAMQASSLTHLTAVSGANCALVVGIAVGLMAACGARRAWRIAAGMTALVGFVVLVSPEASVVRAAAMAAIAMVALVLGRRAEGLAVLALAVVVVLVADPWMSRSLGFALSVAATAALLVLSRPLTDGLSRILPRSLALAIAVPLAAQLACGPLMLVIRPEVPVFGVVANLLAAPAAPVATVVGLAACLAAPLPVVQAGLAAIAWLPAAWIAGVARTFAALPGGIVPWPDGPAGIALLVVLGAAVLAAVAGVSWRGRARPRLRAVAIVAIGLVAGVGAGQWTLTAVVPSWTIPRDWSIAMCDVGQGDAILVRSAGRVLLIDTGPEPEPLRACLARLGIDRVDLLVLTHFDLDHVGGAEAVAARVGLLLHGPPDSAEDERVLARVRAGRTVRATAGMSGALGDAHWRVLWPPVRSAAFPSGNAASVVLAVDGGGVPSSLYLGDLDAAAQRALAASGRLPARTEVLKVAHHGSADQDPGLHARVDPLVALISVGADNDYGHPRDSLLAILQDVRATVARTDRDGLVLVVADERGLRLWREHARRRPGRPRTLRAPRSARETRTYAEARA